MSEPVLFSIVIPSYNRAAFIAQVIQKFLEQAYGHFELIIVDDGSTDNTGEVVKAISDDRVRYFRKENGERGAARKFGAAQAKGDYINYFDSDDIAYPDHLQKAVELITEKKTPAFFHLGFEYRDVQGKLISRPETVTGTGNDRMLKVNYINPNPVFVHRSTLAEANYCEDRRLAATEDWLYHLQLIARYELVAAGDKITSCMVQHDQRSMSQYNGDKVLDRNCILLEKLEEDTVFMNKYGNHLAEISAEMFGLAALHYVLEKKKGKAVKTLLQAIRQSPAQLFKRRTLAVLKYCIIN